MTFPELKKESYAFKEYNLLTAYLALHDQIPFRAIRIDSGKNYSKYVIFKKSNNPKQEVTTKNISIPKEDVPFFDAWFSNDFPDCEFEILEF